MKVLPYIVGIIVAIVAIILLASSLGSSIFVYESPIAPSAPATAQSYTPHLGTKLHSPSRTVFHRP